MPFKYEKVLIENKNWKILNSTVTDNEGKVEYFENIRLETNLNYQDINSLYSNLSSLTIFELRAKARRLASSHGIKLIIIDYLQFFLKVYMGYYHLNFHIFHLKYFLFHYNLNSHYTLQCIEIFNL